MNDDDLRGLSPEARAKFMAYCTCCWQGGMRFDLNGVRVCSTCDAATAMPSLRKRTLGQ